MHSFGLDRPAKFTAQLTNAVPPGEIETMGSFGPWSPDDPGQTPLAAEYAFDKADLGVFKGISGILSSTGKFGGVLENIEVEGKTSTPDFTVTIGGRQLHQLPEVLVNRVRSQNANPRCSDGTQPLYILSASPREERMNVK